MHPSFKWVLSKTPRPHYISIQTVPTSTLVGISDISRWFVYHWSQIQWSYKSSSITSSCAASVFTFAANSSSTSAMSEVRHPRSHVDDLVSAELLWGISLLLLADTDLLQTPLEGELGLNLLLLAQGKTLLHQLDPLGGPRSRSVLCCVVYWVAAQLNYHNTNCYAHAHHQTKPKKK